MRVAITIWDERISPVFDAAHSLLIADIKNKEIKNIVYESFNPEFEARFTEKLIHLHIDVFICGAISAPHSTLIEATGIQLIAFVSGSVNEILESFARGNPLIPDFLMPGCMEEDSLV